jgi:uncharacterized protein YdeI (YjbR/CyaY-like superfamily)
MAVLQAEGRMTPAGLAAFLRRTEARSRKASYEQEVDPELSPAEIRQFKRHPAAWAFFQAQAPSYRKKLIWLIVSVKRAETRIRRFELTVQACADGKKI